MEFFIVLSAIIFYLNPVLTNYDAYPAGGYYNGAPTYSPDIPSGYTSPGTPSYGTNGHSGQTAPALCDVENQKQICSPNLKYNVMSYVKQRFYLKRSVEKACLGRTGILSYFSSMGSFNFQSDKAKAYVKKINYAVREFQHAYNAEITKKFKMSKEVEQNMVSYQRLLGELNSIAEQLHEDYPSVFSRMVSPIKFAYGFIKPLLPKILHSIPKDAPEKEEIIRLCDGILTIQARVKAACTNTWYQIIGSAIGIGDTNNVN